MGRPDYDFFFFLTDDFFVKGGQTFFNFIYTMANSVVLSYI